MHPGADAEKADEAEARVLLSGNGLVGDVLSVSGGPVDAGAAAMRLPALLELVDAHGTALTETLTAWTPSGLRWPDTVTW